MIRSRVLHAYLCRKRDIKRNLTSNIVPMEKFALRTLQSTGLACVPNDKDNLFSIIPKQQFLSIFHNMVDSDIYEYFGNLTSTADGIVKQYAEIVTRLEEFLELPGLKKKLCKSLWVPGSSMSSVLDIT
eukprot:5292384-Karenia_brevis.AAC.1